MLRVKGFGLRVSNLDPYYAAVNTTDSIPLGAPCRYP